MARRSCLVRKETNPEDIDGMHSAAGILTSTGGMTSHAAVVARGLGTLLCGRCGRGSALTRKIRKIKVNGKTYLAQGCGIDRWLHRRSDGR